MTALLLETVALSLQDSKRHLRYTFTCPAGLQELRLQWQFSPPGTGELRTLITVSLEGPDGFRGAGHRHGALQEVVLSETAATPGYLPGPITPGQWTVTLHTHLVMGHTTGELKVSGTAVPSLQPPCQLPAPVSGPRSPRSWMKGDLHCHTVHSDGRWTPEELAAAAIQQGLSFLALTDHNTVSGRAELAGTFPGMLLPGTELTTFYGHALVLGQQTFPGWTDLEPQGGMADLARRTASSGGYLVLAHPFAEGDPVCTGCAWTYFDLRPENATHLEVWNGPWAGRHNERALAYWYGLLAAGRRLVATTGSDAHGPEYQRGVGFTCTPTTTDPAMLLSQLREGTTYLSAGPELQVEVQTSDGAVNLAGSAPAGRWDVTLSWNHVPEGSRLIWIVDGQRQAATVARSGALQAAFDVSHWLNLEVRSADGELIVLTNPVYALES